MFELRVIVYLNDSNKLENIRAFERIVCVSSSTRVDYNGIVDALQFLYGASVIVVFEVHPCP